VGKYFINIISTWVLVFITTGVHSQVLFTADTSEISWGERATITARMGFSVINDSLRTDELPNWTDTIPGGWEIISSSGPDTLAPSELDPEDWNYVVEKTWAVTAFDSSSIILPGLSITVIPTRTENSKDIIGHAEIYDVKWTNAENIVRWLPYAGWTLLVICLVLGLWFVIKKGRNRNINIEEEIEMEVIPAHIIALKALKELKQREAWKKGDGKTFQVHLSQVIRTYIDARFMVKSLDKTSSEAVQLIKMLDVSESDKQELIAALLTGDKIKFAKFTAADDLHEKSLDTCISFVESSWEKIESNKENRDEVA